MEPLYRGHRFPPIFIAIHAFHQRAQRTGRLFADAVWIADRALRLADAVAGVCAGLLRAAAD